jgi:peptidoglycan/xylan/chitin deacetylase (PgdA/CDA1 family)
MTARGTSVRLRRAIRAARTLDRTDGSGKGFLKVIGGLRCVAVPSDAAGPSRRALLRAAALLPLAGAAACAPSPGTTTPAPTTTSPLPTAAPPPTTGSPPVPPRTGEIEHATSGRQQIALTFHGAGDETLARRVLTLLHDRGAAVTVLAVGTWLQQYPDAARLVTDLGHELGNHTWSHPNLSALDERGIRTEIERCRDRIAAGIGGPGAFFRPSQAQHATAQVRRVAAAAGYPTVLSYDVDSKDFTDPGAAAIRRNVRSATPGSVVSMHLGHPGTLEALPALLDDLATRGLTPVTAGTLFS